MKEGIQALSYHAGLDDKLRIDRQSQWIAEKVTIQLLDTFLLNDAKINFSRFSSIIMS